MNKGLALATLVALAALSIVFVEQSNKVDSFEQWKKDFGTPFQAEEQQYRRLIFERNIKRIESHNADSTQTYTMGVNQFTIYTDEQFQLRFLTEMIVPKNAKVYVDEPLELPTAAIDWTTQGKVSPIKNQGSCGSCWSFSATGVVQSWALFKSQSWNLSEQQLVDCSGSYGNHGCNGGWPSSALKYVQASGLQSESAYPYVARDQTCKMQGGSYKISSIQTAAGCNGMINAITGRPLSITVDATNWSPYRGGVFNNCAGNINHAVLLVGTDASGVWKVKNSWGTGWGESGFIRLAAGNTCGVCTYGGVYVA